LGCGRWDGRLLVPWGLIMIKIFIVIYMASEAIGAMGPLGYDWDVCTRQATSLQARDEIGVRYTCEFHTSNPRNNFDAYATIERVQ